MFVRFSRLHVSFFLVCLVSLAIVVQCHVLAGMADTKFPISRSRQNHGHRIIRDTLNKHTSDGLKSETPRERWSSKYCCGNDTYDPLSDYAKSLRPVKKECFIEFNIKANEGAALRTNRSKDTLKCIMQCVLQKQNAVDDDGNILPEKMKVILLNDIAKQEWQKKVSDQIFDTCIKSLKYKKVKALIKKSKDRRRKSKSSNENEQLHVDGNLCSPDSTTFINCVFRNMQLMCPEELSKNTTRCVAAKEKYQSKGKYNVKEIIEVNLH